MVLAQPAWNRESANARTRKYDMEEMSETEGAESAAYRRSTQFTRREQVAAVFRRLPPTFKGDDEGTPEQKQKILPRPRSGSLELAFALTEPEAGSDAASLATAVTSTADGFSLRGEKLYTTGASTAELIIVVDVPVGSDRLLGGTGRLGAAWNTFVCRERPDRHAETR